MAKYQPFILDGSINANFGKKFEAYFNDRFFLRKIFIKWNNSYEKRLRNTTHLFLSSNVLLGEEDWLFFATDNSINNYQNKTIFKGIELQSMLHYLEDINTWCKEHGKEFYLIITPDKNKIYGEYFPKQYQKYRENDESRTMQFMRYMEKHSDIPVLYFYDELHANKDKGLLYYKNDTHWTPYGAYIGYTSLMNTINKNNSQPQFTATAFKDIKYLRGDLTGMLPDGKDDTKSIYKIPIFETMAEENIFEDNVIEFDNPQGKKSLFLLRDSFSVDLLPYLSYSFEHIYAKHRMLGLTTSDLEYMKNNTDIFIIQVVERFLDFLIKQNFPKGEQE